ncbi:MAG TPA: acyloxyacyl hydrolase [Fimbriimonadaceae bacterium]|nr:acyloxyacyl hydrolase [Fimbriimonadaceae bacterium]
MSLRALGCVFVLLSTGLVARAQEKNHWAFNVGPANSFKDLGSEDARHGWYFSLQHFAHEPRFKFWGFEADFVKEAYYMHTIGGGFRVWPVTRAHNFGITLAGRFWLGHGYFMDAGWGLDYINRLTYDVYTRLNSSPVLGFGSIVKSPMGELQVSLRWKHISNAGTAGHNEGENYLVLAVGLRF